MKHLSKDFIIKIWKDKIDNSNITILDPKTALQEYSLKKYKKLPFYKTIDSAGPRHNPVYRVSVSIVGSKKFVGLGKSKQLAELDAASKLLKGESIS